MASRLLIALYSFASLTLAVDKTVNPELSSELRLDTTMVDYHDSLKNDDWHFVFPDQPGYTFRPGSVVNANAATWPAAEGFGMTLAMLNLGPCAMLPPHLHPRATNFVVAVQGNTTTWMINENGVDVVTSQLTPGGATIFPAGSLHSMANQGCDNAQLVSALNSADTGTLNIFNGAFKNIPTEYLQAALGYTSIDFEKLAAAIPDVGTGSISGSESCLRRCGLWGQGGNGTKI